MSNLTTSSTPQEAPASHIVLGCFEVAGGDYAVDVSQVREVVRWQPVTPLPKAPALIEGVIDLRGVIVPIVDLGRVFTGRLLEPSLATRIAVVEVDGLLVGLIVDAAIEVLSIDVSCIDDPPALATQAGYDTTRAVVRRAGAKPILVVSLENVLECVYRSAICTAEDPS